MIGLLYGRIGLIKWLRSSPGIKLALQTQKDLLNLPHYWSLEMICSNTLDNEFCQWVIPGDSVEAWISSLLFRNTVEL